MSHGLQTEPYVRILGETSYEERLRQSVRNALGTPLGSRPDAPASGSLLHRFAFRRYSAQICQDICDEVARCLRQSEPRIQLSEAYIERLQDGVLRIHLAYTSGGQHRFQATYDMRFES